jgi:hypothetical protein
MRVEMTIKKTITGMMIAVIGSLIIIGTFKGSIWAMSLAHDQKNPVKIQMVVK